MPFWCYLFINCLHNYVTLVCLSMQADLQFCLFQFQLANSMLDYDPSYDSDQASGVMPSSFHDISDVEFQDNWGRVWWGLETFIVWKLCYGFYSTENALFIQGGSWNIGLSWIGCITQLSYTIKLRVSHLSLYLIQNSSSYSFKSDPIVFSSIVIVEINLIL